MRKLTPDEVQQRVDEICGRNTLILDVSTYQNVRTKCRFLHQEYGEWWVKPDNIFSGQKHSKSWRISKIMLLDDVRTLIRENHGEIVTIDSTTYRGCCLPARFIDVEFGEWFATPSHVISGHGHPKRGIAIRSIKHIIDVDSIIDRLKNVHGDELILDASTYQGSKTLTKFIDKDYGEWWSTVNNVLNGHGHPKRANTKKNKTMTKTLRSYPPIFHWRTKQVCYSQSGYEYATLMWLNKNNYDFDWQIPIETIFKNRKINRNSIYTIDLFIKDGPFMNTFVEIKGYWRSVKSGVNTAKRNWEWFHANHPNSELWMYRRLKELAIIS